jgi:opacity protein-like surface antigen
MRKSCAVILLLAVFGMALPVKAQDDATKLEAYAGYDYIRFNVNANVSGIPPSQSFNGNGGGGQLEFNANNWLGIVADLSGYGVTDTSSHLVGWVIPYLFGPRINFRHGRVTPFAQALFGGVLASSTIGGLGSQNNFAMTAGGGIDICVSRHFSIRPVQAEYFLTKIPDGLNNRQNNFRFSAGIIFRFGRS